MKPTPETPPEFITLAEQYRPDPAELSDLRRKFIVPVVGPTAVGKTTIIDSACRKRSGKFGYAHSFTTRPQRAGESDDAYTFLPHDPDTIDELTSRMKQGSLAQIAVHPTTGFIYGSGPESYTHMYSLIDMLYNGVKAMRRLPFGHCTTISIVTEAPLWQERFDDRFADPTERLSRLQEADASLRWSQKDVESHWLLNRGAPYKVADELIGIATGDKYTTAGAREHGVKLHNHILEQLRADELAA